MKCIFKILFISAVSLLCNSCQKEQDITPDSIETTFLLNIGSQETKAVSQAENVDRVYYEVWDETFTRRLLPTDNSGENYAPVQGKVAKLNLQLLKDQKFNLIFWAQNSGCSVYSWTDLKNITVDYSGFKSNNKDVYDAFYAVEPIVSDGKPKEVSLYRPFAQLNFGTDKMKTSIGEFTLESNYVTISKVATSFNTLTGLANQGSYDKGATFTASTGGLVQSETADKKDLLIGSASYYWVAMNYLFVPSATDEATVIVDAGFNTSQGTVTHKILDVPLKRNYKTNIVGDLFTTTAELKIIVKEDFNKPDLEPKANN